MSKSNQRRPKCKLIGENGNIFVLAAIVLDTLEEAGLTEHRDEIKGRLFTMGSYEETLNMFSEYVDVE